MADMLELSVNLGNDEAVKVTVSNVDLANGFFDVGAIKHHFVIGESTGNRVIYNAIVTESLLNQLGNPKEIWVFVE